MSFLGVALSIALVMLIILRNDLLIWIYGEEHMRKIYGEKNE